MLQRESLSEEDAAPVAKALRREFRRYGPIVKTDVRVDGCYVIFASGWDSWAAVRALKHGGELDGRKFTVRMANDHRNCTNVMLTWD